MGCYGRSQMLTQNDFAVITKLDVVPGISSQRSALLQEQPEQVFYSTSFCVNNNSKTEQ